jgi:hypothetical protein
MVQETLTMPAFKPLRRRQTILMLGLAEWLRTGAVLAVCAGLAFALGLWQHEVDAPVPTAERLSVEESYKTAAAILGGIDERVAASGAKSAAEIELSQSERDAINLAREVGLHAGMGDDEISGLVPKTEKAMEPVIPVLPRFGVVAGLPTLIAWALQAEFFRNSNLARECARILRNRRRPHVYLKDTPAWYSEGGDDVR